MPAEFVENNRTPTAEQIDVFDTGQEHEEIQQLDQTAWERAGESLVRVYEDFASVVEGQAILRQLTGAEEIDPKKYKYDFEHRGSSIVLALNEAHQLKSLSIDGVEINLKRTRRTSDLPTILYQAEDLVSEYGEAVTEVTLQKLGLFSMKEGDAEYVYIHGFQTFPSKQSIIGREEDGRIMLEKGMLKLGPEDQFEYSTDDYHNCIFQNGLAILETSYGGSGLLQTSRSIREDGKIESVQSFHRPEESRLADKGGVLLEKRVTDLEGKVLHQEKFHEDGSLKEVIEHSNMSTAHYFEGGILNYREDYSTKQPKETYYSFETGKPIYEAKHSKTLRHTWILPDGQRLQDFLTEKSKNPELTKSAYIDQLTRYFTTPETWNIFAKAFMNYTHDSPRRKTTGKQEVDRTTGEYWQLAEETIGRVNEEGRCLGDCDDFAFLAKEILRRQGKKAEVVAIPHHALCVWVEKNSDNSYSAFSVDTAGYDKNGDYDQYEDLSRNGKKIKETTKGFRNPTEAVNAILRKYRKKLSGVESGMEIEIKGNKFTRLSVSEDGERQFEERSINELIND